MTSRPGTLLAAFIFALGSAGPAVASTLAHEGYLLDSSDGAVNAASQAFGFSLYSVSSGGTAFWTGTCTRPVQNGYYVALLGDGTCGAAITFPVASPWFLEVTVASVVLTPRETVGTVPSAETLGGLAVGDLDLRYAKLATGVTAGTNDVLHWSGSAWTPGAVGTSLSASAPLSMSAGSPSTISLARSSSTVDGYLAHDDFAAFNGKASTSDARLSDSRAPTGLASGDLGGTYPGPTVAKLQGFPVSSASPASGQVLAWSGAQWVATTISGGGAGGGSGGGTGSAACANLEGAPQTFSADQWTGVVFSNTTVASNVTAIGRSLSFTSPGLYRFTLSFRPGAGADVWSAVRLFGDGGIRGYSAGHGNFGPSTSEFVTYDFLAVVDNVTMPYELQVGRLSDGWTVVTPNTLVGLAPPAVQATVERLGDMTGAGARNAAQFDGPGQAFTGAAWTAVKFDGVTAATTTWALTSGTNVKFPAAGVYRVSLSYRFGTGTDDWTAVRLFGNGAQRGISAGSGNATNSTELFTWEFLAQVPDATQTYQLQVGRGSGTQTLATSADVHGLKGPAVQATFVRIGDMPPAVSTRSFAQLEGAAQTFAATAWTGVSFNNNAVSSAITVSGANITVPRAGIYRVTLSYRHGAGGDVWAAVRLFGDGAAKGVSAGTGNTANSSELFTYDFLAQITNAAVTYQIQVGQDSASAAVVSPSAIASVTPPAVQATIEEL